MYDHQLPFAGIKFSCHALNSCLHKVQILALSSFFSPFWRLFPLGQLTSLHLLQTSRFKIMFCVCFICRCRWSLSWSSIWHSQGKSQRRGDPGEGHSSIICTHAWPEVSKCRPTLSIHPKPNVDYAYQGKHPEVSCPTNWKYIERKSSHTEGKCAMLKGNFWPANGEKLLSLVNQSSIWMLKLSKFGRIYPTQKIPYFPWATYLSVCSAFYFSFLATDLQF